jgi:translation initiation factor 1A
VVPQLGDRRLQARCKDNLTRLATNPGSIYPRTTLTPGDWVLVGIRPFQTDRADVLLKYTEDEARQLRSMGLIETLVTDVKEEFRDPEEKEKEEDVNFDDL